MSPSTTKDPLGAFLASLPEADTATASPIEPGADPVDELVWSMLLWDAPRSKADRAHKRLLSAVVDVNELRVCMPDEVISLIGKSYPNAAERAERLLSALHAVYLREHAVTLAPLRSAPKREARKYLESIEAAPQFVSARVLLLGLGAHALPLDSRMFVAMQKASAFETDADETRAVSVLERTVKASDALAVHASMLDWIESGKTTASRPRRSAGKSPSKKKQAAKSK